MIAIKGCVPIMTPMPPSIQLVLATTPEWGGRRGEGRRGGRKEAVKKERKDERKKERKEERKEEIC